MSKNPTYLAFAWWTGAELDRFSKGGARDCIGCFPTEQEARAAVEQWSDGGKLEPGFDIVCGQVSEFLAGRLTLLAQCEYDRDNGLPEWKDVVEPKLPKYLAFAHINLGFNPGDGSGGGMGDFVGAFVELTEARDAVAGFWDQQQSQDPEIDTNSGHVAMMHEGNLVIVASYSEDVLKGARWSNASGKELQEDDDWADLRESLEPSSAGEESTQ